MLEFLDSLPGKTRSEKLERVLKRFRELEAERLLRHQLGELREIPPNIARYPTQVTFRKGRRDESLRFRKGWSTALVCERLSCRTEPLPTKRGLMKSPVRSRMHR